MKKNKIKLCNDDRIEISSLDSSIKAILKQKPKSEQIVDLFIERYGLKEASRKIYEWRRNTKSKNIISEGKFFSMINGLEDRLRGIKESGNYW